MTAKGRDIYLKESATRKRNEEAAKRLQETGHKLWKRVKVKLEVK